MPDYLIINLDRQVKYYNNLKLKKKRNLTDLLNRDLCVVKRQKKIVFFFKRERERKGFSSSLLFLLIFIISLSF